MKYLISLVIALAMATPCFALDNEAYVSNRAGYVDFYRNHSAIPTEFSATYFRTVDNSGEWMTAASMVAGASAFDSFYINGYEAEIVDILDGVAILSTPGYRLLEDAKIVTPSVGDDLFYVSTPRNEKKLSIRMKTDFFDGRIFRAWTFVNDISPRPRDIGSGVYNQDKELVGIVGATGINPCRGDRVSFFLPEIPPVFVEETPVFNPAPSNPVRELPRVEIPMYVEQGEAHEDEPEVIYVPGRG